MIARIQLNTPISHFTTTVSIKIFMYSTYNNIHFYMINMYNNKSIKYILYSI